MLGISVICVTAEFVYTYFAAYLSRIACVTTVLIILTTFYYLEVVSDPSLVYNSFRYVVFREKNEANIDCFFDMLTKLMKCAKLITAVILILILLLVPFGFAALVNRFILKLI